MMIELLFQILSKHMKAFLIGYESDTYQKYEIITEIYFSSCMLHQCTLSSNYVFCSPNARAIKN